MTSRLLVGLALFALLLWGAPAQATDSFGHVVTACGLEAYKVGNSGPFTLLATGELCSTGGGGGGGGGTSSSFGAAFPATGTAIGVKNGANMVNLTADGSSNLNINCVVGCAGGTFNNNADAVATSATNGQTAAWNYGFNGTTWDRLRVDGSKNLLIAGTVTANAGTNLNTSLLALESGGNLATLAGGVTTSVYQTNEKQINGVTPLMGNGVTGTGAQRVTIASDNTAFTVNAAESGTWNITNISGTITLPTLAATSTKQSDGSQKTQIVDGSGNVIASTSNNLNVQCANCSGSGASAADEASFTAGTSVFAPSGGFFQTTATSNALTNGQQGQVQMTANRAFMINLRNASGVELGVAAAPIQVSLANNGANATAVLVNQPTAAGLNATVVGTGTFATQSAITAASGSIASGAIASGAVASGAYASGSISDGAEVTLGAKADAKSTATDTTAITIMQVLKEISAMAQAPAALPANQSMNEAQINGVTPLMGNGATGTGSQRVTIASDNTAFSVNGTLQTQTDTIMVGGVNIKEINAVTPLMGNGVTGTGSQRVTIASDNTAFAVNGTLQTQTDTIMVGGVNVKEINAVTPLMGNGTTGTGSLRVTVASDNTAFSVNGTLQTQTDTVMVGGINVKEINAVTPLMGNGVTGTGSQRVTIASDNTAFAVNAQPSPTTTGGLTFYIVQPAASDNHVVIKAGAGQVYHIAVMNNSATVNYLRLYNATTGFNGCNSATNLQWDMIIPASTSGAGFVDDIPLGIAFATGISICVTSGYATNDTTNATATAMTVNIGYK